MAVSESITPDRDGALDAPVIDLGAPSRLVTRQVAEACEAWGFFQVVGHGLDEGLMAAADHETRRFFARPMLAKRGLARTAANPWGYYDRELTKNLRDKKEIFDIGPDAVLDDTGPRAARTPWPHGDETFRSTLLAFKAACESLGLRLLDLIGAGLRAPEAILRAAFTPASTSFLRLNHYPVVDPLGEEARSAAAGADLGIHHHTDSGAVTVLMQDGVRGLQVWWDGDWRTVAPTPGALVINIGDMMQVWSNDLYPAPVHRVLAMDAVPRISLAHFCNPAYEAMIAPLENVLDVGRPARYRPIPWGEFRRRRADGDFADYGAEVQISDYRV